MFTKKSAGNDNEAADVSDATELEQEPALAESKPSRLMLRKRSKNGAQVCMTADLHYLLFNF